MFWMRLGDGRYRVHDEGHNYLMRLGDGRYRVHDEGVGFVVEPPVDVRIIVMVEHVGLPPTAWLSMPACHRRHRQASHSGIVPAPQAPLHTLLHCPRGPRSCDCPLAATRPNKTMVAQSVVPLAPVIPIRRSVGSRHSNPSFRWLASPKPSIANGSCSISQPNQIHLYLFCCYF